MKDEIKEILEDMNYRPERAFIISADEKHLLLNYITNLQEENQRLKVNCNVGNENLTFYRNSYKDYKTRNEKAIEYIENNEDFETEIFDCNTGGCLGTDLSIQAKTLLNILQGKNDE